MIYPNGQSVIIGDVVELGKDSGVVVAVIDEAQYFEGFSALDWSYLNKGILVRFEKNGLIHYEEIEPDLNLIMRGNRT